MRSEFKEYYSSHKKKTNIVKKLFESLIISYYRMKFLRIDLGSEKWHATQHKVANLSATNFHSSIRSLFYEITMKNNCDGKIYCLPHVCLNFPLRIKIGYNVFINRNVNIVARDKIIIGDNVMIGPNTVINSGTHNFEDADNLIRNQGHRKAPIIIENNVFIGGNSFILPGITIGEGSVVGAGSIVTKNVEPFTVVVGNPARIIKRRK